MYLVVNYFFIRLSALSIIVGKGNKNHKYSKRLRTQFSPVTPFIRLK